MIFGNSVAGTPLMDARPLAALDLPLKIVIRKVIAPVASIDALTDALVAETYLPYFDASAIDRTHT